jgi:glycosyltransferase involved in cell wall biosynthesis
MPSPAEARTPRLAVIIPVLNEEEALPRTLAAIPAHLNADVIVADNGSADRTPEVAVQGGARVVFEPERGYGAACLAGIAALQNPEIVVFLDGDYSDFPEEMPSLLAPLLANAADLVIGSRIAGQRERGALPPHAVFGNRLAASLLRLLYGQRVTDLGPFRAIRYDCLQRLQMQDRGFGWTVEMQIKAARRGLRTREVPVSYRRRVGASKISGTVKGTILAGSKILYLIGKYGVAARLGRARLAACRPGTPEPAANLDHG